MTKQEDYDTETQCGQKKTLADKRENKCVFPKAVYKHTIRTQNENYRRRSTAKKWCEHNNSVLTSQSH